MPSVVSVMRALGSGSAAEVAELHATTSSFARRPAAPRRSPRRSARSPPASVRRRGTARCPRGTGSPRGAAARAARAAPSARRRRVEHGDRPVRGSLGPCSRRRRMRAIIPESATVSGSCARWWSPTCSPRRTPRARHVRARPGAGAAAACRASTSSCTSSRPGRAARTRARDLRRRFGGPLTLSADHQRAFDVVHAHFGLTAWPALAVPARVRALTVHGTDVRHPRTR